jgi:precorrin-6y C5,15-methyltransferase (decarboxylating) CbiE subunit
VGRKKKEGAAMIYIVGLGPGSRDYILPKALEIMKSSDIILGFDRAVRSLEFIETEKRAVKGLGEVLEYINNNPHRNISVAASGDPCFYGIVDYIKRNYSGKVEVIPGLSSFQYLAASLGKPWQGAFLGSLHGRSEDFISKVRENRLSIWLTDKTNTPGKLCRELVAAELEAAVYVGENLSYEDEKIVTGCAKDLVNQSFSELCIVIIEKAVKETAAGG